MRIAFVSLATLLFLASFSAGADFSMGSPEQIVTDSQYTRALKRDPWEKDRWNYIDPMRGSVLRLD